MLSVVISANAARGTGRLQDELETQRQRASNEELLNQVMSRYREPLLRAAFDLHSCVSNIAASSGPMGELMIEPAAPDDGAPPVHRVRRVHREAGAGKELLASRSSGWKTVPGGTASFQPPCA